MSTNRIVFNLSRRFAKVAFAAVGTAMLAGLTGCGGGTSSGPINVPLSYRPGDSDTGSITVPVTDVKVHLASVVDKRDKKDQIGQNTQNEKIAPVPVFAADTTPMEFYQTVLEDQLKSTGLELVEAPEAADRIISVDLNRFWAEEDNNFQGDVQATVQVSDKGGRVLWKGKVAGDRKTFGRSRNAANYNLVLSDATRRSVTALMSNPGFQQALTR